MKADYITICLILSLLASFRVQSTSSIGHEINHRRILHQPLFPESSAPPPQPPPPPPAVANPDQPFFHALPNGQPMDPNQQTPPSPPTKSSTSSNAVAARPSNQIKKVAIAITSAIVTIGMLSALAFYLYKHRCSHRNESQKLVGGSSQRMNEESRMPPSTFLYIGTVEPSTTSIVNEANDATGSPYRKLNSGKRSSRYRPSPELQPLPPLPKPPPPPSINSPPPMSSSDDESHDTNFYTPQGSSLNNESPASRQSYLNNIISQVNQSRRDKSIPHSKRTSPKSRLSASSPDKKPVIIPSIKQSLPPTPPPPPPPASSSLGPLQPSKTQLSYTPIRARFPAPAPPPPPDIARLRSISDDDQQSTAPIPPPPPPPPPPQLPIPRKAGSVKTYTPSPVSREVIRPQSMSPSSKANPGTENTSPIIGEDNRKDDSVDKDGSKPKLKPLHWDKVRATSDRATVWDQIKSSSFQ